jgi:predicted  nucleic acid-binding Zn-ribbon protein
MTKEHIPEEIKNRLSNIGEAIGGVALEYIAELEHQLTHRNCLDCSNHSSKLRIRTLELEKENAELERKLEQTEKDLADYQFNYPTIKELQKELDYQKQARSIAENAVVDLTKENTELKEELKDANKKVVHIACNQNKDLKRKINKAKEIIKNLMVFAEMDDREYEKEYKEAKQFLNSEVEKCGQ